LNKAIIIHNFFYVYHIFALVIYTLANSPKSFSEKKILIVLTYTWDLHTF